MQKFQCGFDDTGCIHSVVGIDLFGITEFYEGIGDADFFQCAVGAVFYQHVSHDRAQTAVNIVILYGDDLSAGLGSLQNGIFVRFCRK